MEKGDPKPLYYSDYLELDKILSSQHPKSFSPEDAFNDEKCYDEMLFIIVHQAYELWFAEILFELDLAIKVIGKKKINDNTPELSNAVHRLKRIVKIFELLNHQVDVLETMTPLDFLEFRKFLLPASGFQSVQFRIIEARLGLRMENRHDHEYYKRRGGGGFSAQDYALIESAEKEKTLKKSTINWLKRMPYLGPKYWGANMKTIRGIPAFWFNYRKKYLESLSAEERSKEDEDGKTKEDRFDEIFMNKGVEAFPAKAIRGALFIMLYRNWPVFHLPFELLNTLIEIDELLSTWRYRHLNMVRRMIGGRAGTGGTEGAKYLEGAVNKNYIFRELTAITTYMMERSKLPKLPDTLKKSLIFSS